MFPESSPSPTIRSGDIAGLPDPPTLVSLANAKLKLTHHVKDLGKLNDRITQAEAHLAQIVLEARYAINEMAREKSDIEDQILLTRSYLSPIRRLPSELLSYVFYWCFDEHPCCAWILSAVCRKWRRLALSMPKIWSKIRLLTTQHSSPDIIRLWLERSGPTVPLDIEIYLRVVNTPSDIPPNTRIRGRRSTSPASPAAFFYSSLSAYHHHHQVSFPGGAGSPLAASPPVTHYVIPHPATPLPPAHTPLIVPLASHPTIHDGWSSPISSSPPSFLPIHAHRERRAAKCDSALGNGPRNGMHWGWIVMFYLVEQMHRWERFVFRFDKHFNSMPALKSINGEAPLLKEFEISCAEPGYYRDATWQSTLVFPSTSPSSESSSTTTPPPLQSQLRSLTLQNAPFKWSSTMFHTNLHTLNLRALPSNQLPLDRITHILQANRTSLRCLSLHLQYVTQAVLPLNPIVLPELTEFSIGGHYYLSQLVEVMNLPSLEEFNIDIEAREPIEDVIQGLVTRMGAVGGVGVGIKHLSVAYGYGCGRKRATNDSASTPPTSMYYGAGSIMSWAFLMDMGGLESLRVGGTQMDTLLSALGTPDDDMLSGSAAVAGGVPGSGTNNGWLCPNLTELALKHCNSHSEGVGKLVQVVDARNPHVGGSGGGNGSGSGSTVVNGVAPTKLTSLELYDCASLGPDVLDWLKARVKEVVVTEPLVERSSMSPY